MLLFADPRMLLFADDARSKDGVEPSRGVPLQVSNNYFQRMVEKMLEICHLGYQIEGLGASFYHR